jgi:thioredoxin-dependent peroxiredoxin
MPTLTEGDTAPAFTLTDQDGTQHKLSDYKGQWVVLFAYPKDMTPGCTKEACGFRDLAKDFQKRKARVFGLSILGTDSKAKFAKKHGITYPLLADEDHAVCEKYGVWKEKSLYGRKFMGISRETFVIDPKGKIAKHFEKAKGNEDHAQEVLDFLDAQK